jgi:O-methyltransferase
MFIMTFESNTRSERPEPNVAGTQDRTSKPHSSRIGSTAWHHGRRLVRLATLVARRPTARSSGNGDPATQVYGITPSERTILEEVRPYTLTSDARLLATMDAVDYAVASDIPGSLVECGVWKGGSVLAMIRTLQRRGVSDRHIYLYDTFEGMTEPSIFDVSAFDEPALDTWRREEAAGRLPWDWAFDPHLFNLTAVQQLLLSTGYPPEMVHFVVGPVEQTLPGRVPDRIAVLRLDTDWYESTRHEMEHLYPLISSGGVLIIDDYGHWEGAKRAVDEYFDRGTPRPLLCRSDYTGRIGTKP